MPERKVIITYRSLGNGLTPWSVTWSCCAEVEPKPNETVKMPARIRAGAFVSFAICLICFSFLINKFQFLYSWLFFLGGTFHHGLTTFSCESARRTKPLLTGLFRR